MDTSAGGSLSGEPGRHAERSAPGTTERHVPVLLERTVELLAPALSGERVGDRAPVVVDATLGLGGHTEAILRACPRARVVGIDRDPEALALALERLAPFGDRVVGVPAVYDEIAEVVSEHVPGGADAILFDLGVSSLQLDETSRGFAYSRDAPLDMRMDATEGPTAADVLNTYPAAELTRILRDYGEERFARKIAAAIVREREREPFASSARLVEMLRDVVPAASQRSGGHPAKRTFQALRIEVNGELDALEAALPAAIGSLRPGGRVAVLAYHSLEDRMVKRVLAAGSRSSAPPGLPVELPEHAPELSLLTRGSEVPSDEEIARNPRAASVRLRAAERIRPAASAAARPRTTRTTRTTATRTKGQPR